MTYKNDRVSTDYPKQYQQGWVEFYKLKFQVSPAVLIPRPETELLVDEVLNIINHLSSGLRYPISVLDVGTGSGCIAISLAKHLPTWNVGTRITATDISKKALEVAKDNAKLHEVDKQISFAHADLLNPVIDKNLALHPRGANVSLISVPDLIVANLPYIPSTRIPYLDPSVKDFEPIIALDGGFDGFDLYRKLFSQLKRQFERWQPKYLIAEIDYTHGELAAKEVLKYFPTAFVEVKKDLAKKQRILTVKFNSIGLALAPK